MTQSWLWASALVTAAVLSPVENLMFTFGTGVVEQGFLGMGPLPGNRVFLGNTRNPSLSLALSSSLMGTFSLETPRGTFSLGGGVSLIRRPQAGVGPKVCDWG